MEVKIKLNGKTVVDDIPADMLLIDFVRAHGCKSVKRGCETSACGLCTVLLDGEPVLSCSTLAARADGRSVCIPSRACRPRRPSSWASSPTRAPSSAVSATPAS